MILKPLLRNKFSCLVPLLKHRLAEAGHDKNTTPEYIISQIELAYDIRSAGVYVDNEESPNHCLVMSHFPGILVQGLVAYVHLLYSIPSARGDSNAVEVMLRTAENYARLNGAVLVQGASWQLGGKSTDLLWKKDGYVLQEKVFVKHLT